MSDYILLSGVGPDKPGIARSISGAAFTAGCSIEDSRMAVLGGEFAILVLIEGTDERRPPWHRGSATRSVSTRSEGTTQQRGSHRRGTSQTHGGKGWGKPYRASRAEATTPGRARTPSAT